VGCWAGTTRIRFTQDGPGPTRRHDGWHGPAHQHGRPMQTGLKWARPSRAGPPIWPSIGPTNCSCDKDLLLFRLSTNLVGERDATLQLSSGFGSHHRFMDLATQSLLGHPISGLFPAKIWATRCFLSIVLVRSIARFASCVELRLFARAICACMLVPSWDLNDS
jgi:hypothetical protein